MTAPIVLSQRPQGPATLADSPAAMAAGARRLATGIGPVAIDTERSANFRYDDRAFLIQFHRRGCGTILVDPDRHRDHFRRIFPPVINKLDWVMHAGTSDHYALQTLGLYPCGGSERFFDTLIAAQFLGYHPLKLGALTETILGIRLAKGHGAEDWSYRPLPQSWQDYAALDVDYLLDVADTLAHQLSAAGRLPWALEEFHVTASVLSQAAARRQWVDTAGVRILREPQQLAVFRHLWMVRDRVARRMDRPADQILHSKILVYFARYQPHTLREVLALAAPYQQIAPRSARRWLQEIIRARATPAASWPSPKPPTAGVPRSLWKQEDPVSYERFIRLCEDIEAWAGASGMSRDLLPTRSALAAIVWHIDPAHSVLTVSDVREAAMAHLRVWQAEAIVPLIATHYAELVRV